MGGGKQGGKKGKGKALAQSGSKRLRPEGQASQFTSATSGVYSSDDTPMTPSMMAAMLRSQRSAAMEPGSAQPRGSRIGAGSGKARDCCGC